MFIFVDRKRLPSSEEDDDKDFMDKKKKGKNNTKGYLATASGFIVDLSQSDENSPKQSQINEKPVKNGYSSPVLYADEDRSSDHDEHQGDSVRQLQSQPVSQKSQPKPKRSAISSATSADETSPQWPRASRTNGLKKKKKELINTFEDSSLVVFGQAQHLTQHSNAETCNAHNTNGNIVEEEAEAVVASRPPVHEEVSLTPPLANHTSSAQTYCPVCKLNISTVSPAVLIRSSDLLV